MPSPTLLTLRIAFVGVALVLWFWTQKLISQKGAPAGGGVDLS